jgi:hypothetical protein
VNLDEMGRGNANRADLIPRMKVGIGGRDVFNIRVPYELRMSPPFSILLELNIGGE